MTYQDQSWRYAAATLRLALYEPVEPYESSACFGRLERARGAPTSERNEGKKWMSGRVHVAPAQRDVEVLVLPEDVSTHNHAAHGAGHATHTASETYTHVIARIDPPLFVGMKLVSPRPMDPLLGPKLTLMTGDPALDSTFGLNAANPAQAMRLLSRVVAPPNDLLDHLHALRAQGSLRISDTSVAISSRYTDDAAVLGPRLFAAASLAAFVSSRRAALPLDAEETSRLNLWRSFAESSRLALDEARLMLTGAFGGGRVRFALETEAGETFTSLLVEAPRSLELGLRITKQGALQFFAGLFGSQDVRVGDAVFDKAFVVKAKNEGGVRAFFAANPAARQALVELSQVGQDLVMDDARLTLRWPGVADTATLQAAWQRATAVAAAFAPSLGTNPAYR